MLKNKIAIGSIAALVVSGLFAFEILTTGTIKGTVMPIDAGSRAWALSPTDTLRATITQGAYEIRDAKPGAYRIIIEAKPPFKNAAKDSVR
ncbi:MAG: carboxypeptidase regulatory-like domain-containing protein, partial [Chitinophagaceae bacterium]